MRLRFHMAADDFVGGHGWYIDHFRVNFPTGPPTDVGSSGPRLAIGAPWPNPAHERLRISLALPRAAQVDWSLFDLADLGDGALDALWERTHAAHVAWEELSR